MWGRPRGLLQSSVGTVDRMPYAYLLQWQHEYKIQKKYFRHIVQLPTHYVASKEMEISQQTNSQLFTGQMYLAVAQPILSEHWMEKYHIPQTCSPQVQLGVFWLCLWGGVAKTLISFLTPLSQLSNYFIAVKSQPWEIHCKMRPVPSWTALGSSSCGGWTQSHRVRLRRGKTRWTDDKSPVDSGFPT